MTTLNDWADAPSPAGDPTLHAHKLGLHDVPEDDCPACRVDRGAALLDERRPGWWEDVDVERLNMGSYGDHLLVRVFGYYGEGLEALGLRSGIDHGLVGPDSLDAILTELWRSKISERRAR